MAALAFIALISIFTQSVIQSREDNERTEKDKKRDLQIEKQGALLDEIRSLVAADGVTDAVATPTVVKADGLAKLPTHPDDVIVELLGVSHGSTLDFEGVTMFVKLRMVSKINQSILGLKAKFALGGKTYESNPVSDLSEWELVTYLKVSNAPYKRQHKINLQTISLWNSLQNSHLIANCHQDGFVAFHIPSNDPHPVEHLTKIVIEATTAKSGDPYKFTFRTWGKVEGIITDLLRAS